MSPSPAKTPASGAPKKTTKPAAAKAVATKTATKTAAKTPAKSTPAAKTPAKSTPAAKTPAKSTPAAKPAAPHMPAMHTTILAMPHQDIAAMQAEIAKRQYAVSHFGPAYAKIATQSAPHAATFAAAFTRTLQTHEEVTHFFGSVAVAKPE